MADEYGGKTDDKHTSGYSDPARGSRWADELQDEESVWTGKHSLNPDDSLAVSRAEAFKTNYGKSAISGMPKDKQEEDIPEKKGSSQKSKDTVRKKTSSAGRRGTTGKTVSPGRTSSSGKTGSDRIDSTRKKTAVRNTAASAQNSAVRRKRRRKKSFRRRLRAHLIRIFFGLFVVLIAAGIIFGARFLFLKITGGNRNASLPDYVKEELLTVNAGSRPGTSVQGLNGIVIHEAPVRGQTAEELRDTWENLKDNSTEHESSNFIIDITGDVILCVPVGEIAYASDSRNTDTVSITYCYDTEDGSPSEEARASLVSLAEWLCSTYEINPSSVIRHYDINGRNCPAYFVAATDVWDQFVTEIGGTPAAETEESAVVETDENGETIVSSESGDGSGEESSSSDEDDIAVDG